MNNNSVIRHPAVDVDSSGRNRDGLYVIMGDNPSEWESSTLPAHSTKRLTVRVEVPSTLLQDAIRTFYGIVRRYESYLAETKQSGDYTPWHDAMIYAMQHCGVDIGEQDTTQTVLQQEQEQAQ